ncbi:MAG: glycosyltransferase family 4 protein [Halanaerobiaceae bacterium]|jgi:glycosyltransferase involved in cell wall biosynthesis|nr:glycosyltransferase family 4 protein [Halanaerobiaceae bacterium]
MCKILFLARPDLFRIRAGDTVQIKSIKKHLEGIGVNVDISLDLRPDLHGVDLVHCFNILRIETMAVQVENIVKKKLPLIITPIYWNMSEYLSVFKPDKLKNWAEKQILRGEILNCADLILPNAYQEWDLLKKDFALEKPFSVVFNGVDEFFYIKQNTGIRHGILSVGRIHSRKNQLALIRALKDTEIPLTFVGDNNDPAYYKECLAAASANPNIRFYGGVEEKELLSFYKYYKVHVLASWYDTPGLVNLEAGLAGCKLVTTEKGTAREYLQDLAFYCNPADHEDIRNKVLAAYNAPVSDKLSIHILNNFTWSRIVKSLKKIYSLFLSQYI